MTGDEGDDRPRLGPSTGWALVLGYVALIVPTRFTIVVAMANSLGGSPPLVLGICLGLVLAVVGLFVLVARGGRRAVPVLGAVTFGPYLAFPMLWGPIAGPFAAAMPLTVAGPAGWLLFGAVLLADTAAAMVLHGSDLASVAGFTIIDLNMGLTLFALVRLAVLLTETHAANRQLADLEAANERLRAAGDLRRAIGDRLAHILHASRTPPTPDVLTRVTEISREAAAEARTVAAEPREPLVAAPGDLP
ncbi:MAG: hypothetical protein HOW71_14775, partial [Nonomuraea sp.]|nr:hypothetical protein [Nonomuraea sp.]